MKFCLCFYYRNVGLLDGYRENKDNGDINDNGCHEPAVPQAEHSRRYIDYSGPIFMDKFHDNGGALSSPRGRAALLVLTIVSGPPLLTWSRFECLLK